MEGTWKKRIIGAIMKQPSDLQAAGGLALH